MSDLEINILQNMFKEDCFQNTTWHDLVKNANNNAAYAAYLKTILCCAGCNKIVVNCQLEDKLRGLSSDSKSIDKYFALNTCVKCLEIGQKFVFCVACTSKQQKCNRSHLVKDYLPI